MEMFMRTYNGVGCCEARRLRVGYVAANTRMGIAKSPPDPRHTIAGGNSQNMSSGGNIAPTLIINPNSMYTWAISKSKRDNFPCSVWRKSITIAEKPMKVIARMAMV